MSSHAAVDRILDPVNEPGGAGIATNGAPFSRTATAAFVFAIAFAAAAVAFASMRGAGGLAKDFTIPWTAAHALLDGHDPYAMPGADLTYPLGMRFVYPLPAATVVMPLVWIPVHVAGVLFVALSFGALAWVLVREGPHRLWLAVSFPAVMAAILGQWSPLLLAAMFVPALQFVVAAKPTVGIAAMLYRPSRLGIALALALAAVTFIVAPHWLGAWREAAAVTARIYTPPAMWYRGVGSLVLVALARWRDRDARHVALMACVPQLPLFYDQLLLLAVARTRREVGVLVAGSWMGGLLWAFQPVPAPLFERPARALILLFLYLPALVIVLRRPAGGDQPR